MVTCFITNPAVLLFIPRAVCPQVGLFRRTLNQREEGFASNLRFLSRNAASLNFNVEEGSLG